MNNQRSAISLAHQLHDNRIKSRWLIGIFFLIVVGFSYILMAMCNGGATPDPADTAKTVITIMIITGLYILVTLHFSCSMVMSMNHGQRVTKQEAPVLYDIVNEIAISAGLPFSKIGVYIINDPAPNALSTGNLRRTNSGWKGQAAIGATTGIMKILNREELTGVIGHEMGHIKDEDTRVESIGIALTVVFAEISSIAYDIAWFASWSNLGDDDRDDDDVAGALALFSLAIAFLGWLCSGLCHLTQLGLSRNREYLADAMSVKLTSDPEGLINAFRKLIHRPNMKAANPNSNSLFILNPNPEISRSRWSMANILDTHPSLMNRIQRLQQMEGTYRPTQQQTTPSPAQPTQNQNYAPNNATGFVSQAQPFNPKKDYKFCFKCGHQIHADAAFCNYCGAKQPR